MNYGNCEKEKPHWEVFCGFYAGLIFCSECGQRAKEMTNFCTYCGADMRRKANNGKNKA